MINAGACRAPQRILSISYRVGWWWQSVTATKDALTSVCSETMTIIPRQEQKHCFSE